MSKNGQTSSWTNINARVLEGPILGLLLSLNYIIYLPDGLFSKVKYFAAAALPYFL